MAWQWVWRHVYSVYPGDLQVSWEVGDLPGCPRTQVCLLLGPGCQGQAAAGEFGVHASGLSSCLSSSCWGADVGGSSDPLWSQEWRELSRRLV